MTITSVIARILDAADPADNAVLERLRADPLVEFVDHSDEQREELGRLRPPPEAALVAEPGRWVYYPWRRTVAAVLGPRGFRAVRLDRNRNLITAEEQSRLARRIYKDHLYCLTAMTLVLVLQLGAHRSHRKHHEQSAPEVPQSAVL